MEIMHGDNDAAVSRYAGEGCDLDFTLVYLTLKIFRRKETCPKTIRWRDERQVAGQVRRLKRTCL